ARPGDILCADLDNRFIVVDRVKKTVRWSFRPDDAKWSHDDDLVPGHRVFDVLGEVGRITTLSEEDSGLSSRNPNHGINGDSSRSKIYFNDLEIYAARNS
ncbi:MAG: hypothetical protein QXV27_07105, partial [Candidatus Caldarchaeum sp.]